MSFYEPALIRGNIVFIKSRAMLAIRFDSLNHFSTSIPTQLYKQYSLPFNSE